MTQKLVCYSFVLHSGASFRSVRSATLDFTWSGLVRSIIIATCPRQRRLKRLGGLEFIVSWFIWNNSSLLTSQIIFGGKNPTWTDWVGGDELAEEWDPLSFSLEGYLGMRGDGGVKPWPGDMGLLAPKGRGLDEVRSRCEVPWEVISLKCLQRENNGSNTQVSTLKAKKQQ